jgi:hypothetical protein
LEVVVTVSWPGRCRSRGVLPVLLDHVLSIGWFRPRLSGLRLTWKPWWQTTQAKGAPGRPRQRLDG